MHAEIISVGTELTTGAMLDTNSQWLSLELAAVGIPVHFHSTVADNLAAMVSVLRTAVDRSDLILLTGGLGPTLDDLTRQALAELLGVELVLDQGSLDFIRSIFARHKREMPERNTIQAYFPAGSEPLPNPRGTAPGIWAEIPRPAPRPAAVFAAMPGVPSEMKRMFEKEVLPRLPRSDRVILRARINCFGVGESQAEEMLGDLTARGREPEIGITVHEATITLRIVAHGKSAAECREQIDSARAAIRDRMGTLVFGEEDEQIEQVVVRLLSERNLGLAIAEIGTGGLLTHRVTGSAGHERVHRGSFIAPSLDALAAAIAADGDDRVAAAAQRCRQLLAADLALFIGEFPPYDIEDASRRAPKSQIGLFGDGVARVVDYTFLGDPKLNASRAAKVAANLLRLHLLRR